MTNNQIKIELGDTLINGSNYSKVEPEYLKAIKNKEYAPVFMCYNPSTKEYFVSRFFKAESVTNFGCKIIK